MKIGSLFSGYGGLDLGVMDALGGEVAWHVEFDQAPSRILAHHWPDVPNYGDVTAVDWAAVEPVDVLTGGFPCQDVSLAGRRAGLKDGTRSGLWSEFAKAIDELRPRLVVIENVRGLLSAAADSDMEPCPWCVGDNEGEPCLRALGAVLGDLADLGYDTRRIGLRAADAGAPHGRFRVFVVAYPDGRIDIPGRAWADQRSVPRRDGIGADSRGQADADAQNDRHEWAGRTRNWRRRSADSGEPAPDSTGGGYHGRTQDEVGNPVEGATASGGGGVPEWREFAPAVRRWERVIGRLAPAPTAPDGRAGAHRLSAGFVEWMMGLPEGHVTHPKIGLTRAQQLKALGNGVVPQQASLAVRTLLSTYHGKGTQP